ncbi:hypothetical protein P171DRAFT_498642 [Karstenula rhodostoma CBS 690.94]|uniref:BTB domain-containing protein n=1 Tax=Karstenula rhodostoma CBS 690.94 TaxID=1392251 RepID=A0A9P4PDP2_9PLEO|nr:hypothetical protein P171DRAFT_498642 [Karstenula rhodostoma CBS 690.94]
MSPPLLSELASQGTSGLVAVKVSPDLKPYTVHRDILAHYSEYFKSALSSPWEEAEARTVILRDIKPVIFELFLNWTQQHRLCWEAAHAALDEGEWVVAPPVDVECILMLQAWGFADRFLMPDFKEALLYAFVDHLVEYGPASMRLVIHVFNNDLMPDIDPCPFLNVLVDAHCKCWRVMSADEEDVELIGELPIEFVTRVFIRNGELNQGDGFPRYELKGCDYHGHTTKDEVRDCAKRKAQLLVTGPGMV